MLSELHLEIGKHQKMYYLHFVSVFAIELTFNEKPIKILSTESRNSVYVFKESNT